jgi:hypothetical protein
MLDKQGVTLRFLLSRHAQSLPLFLHREAYAQHPLTTTMSFYVSLFVVNKVAAHIHFRHTARLPTGHLGMPNPQLTLSFRQVTNRLMTCPATHPLGHLSLILTKNTTLSRRISANMTNPSHSPKIPVSNPVNI